MVSRVAILGGTQAVSAAVEQQLRDRNISVTRYSGSDRYATAADVARACADGCAAGQLEGKLAGNDRTATSVEVAKFAQSRLGWPLAHVNITRGDAFPDALAGGPHGGQERAAILLTQDPRTLTEPVRRYLRDNAGTINDLDVFGNAAAVSDDVVRQAREEAGDL